MYSNAVVTLPLLDFAASTQRFQMLLESAGALVSDAFKSTALCALSVADCDGREMARWDGSSGAWAGRRDGREPELDLLAFYVTFKNASGKIVTVCVEAAG